MKVDRKARLVLVGGGHAHLVTLRETERLVRAGGEVTLVAPGPYHYYSGMAPGVLGGTYAPGEARFDVKRLVEDRGGRFVDGSVVSVDPVARLLHLSDGGSVPYDFVSFNVGSVVPSSAIPGGEAAFPVKPAESLIRAREVLLAPPRAQVVRVAVIGAGAAGVEVAGNLWRLGRREGLPLSISLLGAEGQVLPGAPERAGRIARRSLEARGVRVLTGRKVVELREGQARDQTGERHDFDQAILTIGIRPTPVFSGSGLATAPDGALLVDHSLRSVGDPRVFGGGDCVALRGAHLPRAGVYAVRQAPILFKNLLAALEGRRLHLFRPQRRYLLILNLGDDTGLLLRGRIVLHSGAAFILKTFLDARFTGKFQSSDDSGRSK